MTLMLHRKAKSMKLLMGFDTQRYQAKRISSACSGKVSQTDEEGQVGTHNSAQCCLQPSPKTALARELQGLGQGYKLV